MSSEAKWGPITPSQAAELKTEQIPEEVFLAFNGLIAQRMQSGRSTVKQKDVIAQLEAAGMDRREIYDKHWLDVEASYRAAGWKVAYDSPSYGDNDFDAYFEFKAADREDS